MQAAGGVTEIISVGECMIELARLAVSSGDAFTLDVGGDTFNTAIYLARLGEQISYMTAVGDDPYSARIVERAAREAVGTRDIVIVPGRRPGLYLIETDGGERSFTYWRDTSPARDLFELAEGDGLAERIARDAGAVYLSGVTLSLYSAAGLETLAGALAAARGRGAAVVVDSNYRAVGWGNDTSRARAVFERFWRLSTIALPSFDDEVALWGDGSAAQTLARFAEFGVGEVCLKMAGEGAMVMGPHEGVHGEEAPHHVPAETASELVDTTAAGDSFSAAYLAARRKGRSPHEAAAAGNRLAALVIGQRGALAPQAVTADFAV